jgi:hypothetical protein
MAPTSRVRCFAFAVAAAREAGAHLRADLHRPEGPRGAIDKADADTKPST